jgi:hypothetical protein
MWRTVLAAIVLLPAAFLGNVLEDESELLEELRVLDHGSADTSEPTSDEPTELWSHHVHKRRHHKHKRHRRHPFLRQARSSSLMQAPADEADQAAVRAAIEAPEGHMFSDRHPSVARKIGYMDEAMRSLKGKREEAAEARNTYETEVKTAVRHLNEVEAMRLALAKTEFAIRAEDRKLHRLADDRLRLDNKHKHLVSSLHHIMEPKLESAESRAEQYVKKLDSLKQRAQRWNAKQEHYHAESLAMLEERRAAKERVELAKIAEAKAHQELEAADKVLAVDKKNVNLDVQGYRYTLAKARAAKSQEEEVQEDAEDAKVAVHRLNKIFHLEQTRVDESMAVAKDRIRGKIREVAHIKEQSIAKLSKQRKKYQQWQVTQQMWARRLESTKNTTHAASTEFAKQQRQVLDDASAQVIQDAMPTVQHDDWAWEDWPSVEKFEE